MLFHDLDEDVLPRILANCDICTVLSCSRVNKIFRAVTLSKQLWLSLLLDLSARSLIRIPPHNFLDYSTDDLIAVVKRLLSGPTTWSHQSYVPPTVSESMSLNNPAVSAGGFGIKLLPGGQYFVVDYGVGIKCCDAKTGDCVWTRPSRVSEYSVDMLDEGRSAIFFLVLYTSPQELAIVHVHFITGHSDELFHTRLNIHMGFCKNPALLGDLLGLALRFTDGGAILVIDWRKQTYVLFNCSSAWPRPGVAFIPGHVILNTADAEEPYEQLILVYALSSLSSRWRPVAEIASSDRLSDNKMRIFAKDITPVVRERLRHQNVAFQNALRIQMTLHANPLRVDAYKLIVYVFAPPRPSSFGESLRRGLGLEPRSASGARLFTYHLVVGPTHLHWARTSVVPAVPDLFFPEVSYAGYTHSQDARERFLGEWAPDAPREIELAETGGDSVHLSSPSGAVTVFKPPKVEINYYV
ncbi:hypothetical protein FB451DRAFT_1564727 [Mycena latifolia]|nr:hypothetical protein FB451DRAFT_1564727 [Mycena latifolia]